MDFLLLLDQAKSFILSHQPQKPPPDTLVAALLEADKIARKTKPSYTPEQLKGTWRLCFVTGTKKAQNRAGIILRSGRYLPRWAKIELTYTPETDSTQTTTASLENCITLGQLKLILRGPAKFLNPKNILAFDFTQITLKIGKICLYQGNIRGGKQTEAKFYPESISKQAFFSYFLIQDHLIAARGRGGGLALWGR